MDKINLLFVISGLDIGGFHGGAERFGVELCQRIDQERFVVNVCAFWKRGGCYEDHWFKTLQDRGINVFYAAEWKGKSNIAQYYRGMRNITSQVSQLPVDVVHSHFQVGTISALHALLTGKAKRIIRTAHITREWGTGIPAWFLRQVFTNWVFPICVHQEVGVSKAVVRQLTSHPGSRLAKKQPRVIYNAIPVLENNCNSQLPEEVSGTIIGSVGRLTHQKGYIYLIDALPTLLQSIPDLMVILVGDGDLRKALEERASELQVSNHIRFLGQQNNPKDWMRCMQLFVLPSLWEGLPTVVLESMSVGVPVLATNVPGTDELIIPGRTGWLIPPADTAALSQAILRAIQDPLERETIRNTALQECKQYSIEKIASQYEDVYARLAGKG